MATRKYFSEFGLNMMSGHVIVLQQDDLDKARTMSKALSVEFYIYLIARRPRIVVDPDTVVITHDEIAGSYSVQRENSFEKHSFRFANALGEEHPEELQFTSPYPHTTYEICRPSGEAIASGKFAQALTIFDPRNLEHVNLEVLYVGQAYGTKGSRNAADRLESHSTLQAIYAEAVTRAPDQEIWLLLCEFNPLLMGSFDGSIGEYGTTDEEDWAHMNRVLNEPLSEQQIVNFTEAALIRYFQPEYNKLFKDTFPNPAHSTYAECYDIDLNAVSVEFNTEILHFQLWSSVIEAKWTHIASFPLHSREERMYMFQIE